MLLDLLSTTILTLILFPIIYFSIDTFHNIYSTLFVLLILVPTLMALVNGAPFVPTPLPIVRKIVKMAKIKPGQKVYDIGCGDCRFVYVAANEYHADAVGIELSPLVYLYALIRKLIWHSQAKIRFGNFKYMKLSDADIIFCYLLPKTLAKIQPALDKKIKPGTRIFSYAFNIPNWKLIHQEEPDEQTGVGPIFVYEKV